MLFGTCARSFPRPPEGCMMKQDKNRLLVADYILKALSRKVR
jgi:hypothetical protein